MTMRTFQRADSIWVPVVAPMIWAAHFLGCYAWMVLACGRFHDSIGTPTDAAITGVTAVALIAISALFVHGWRRHGYDMPDRPNDDASPEDRTRFMAFTTMLLAGLSWIATLYVGLAAWSIGGCW
ncbi:MAG TPA: hypothetical protein VJ691_06510 [Vicinamibacterales bacterium]|nr:hypothetical protein [Vicinamibacterales bacterium]